MHCSCTLLLPSAKNQYFPSQSKNSLLSSGTPVHKQHTVFVILRRTLNRKVLKLNYLTNLDLRTEAVEECLSCTVEVFAHSEGMS